MASVTIWNTLSDPPDVARVATPIYTPAENLEDEGTTEIVYGPPLSHVTDSAWVRPKWHGKPQQWEPWLEPNVKGFKEGWVILVDEIVPPAIPEGHKVGPGRETPLADLEAGRAIWWTTVEMGVDDIAAALAARKTKMFSELRARFRSVRDQGTTIDFGGGAVAIQTTETAANDIQRLHDDLRLRAANGEVDPTQDIATSEYLVVPGVTETMAAVMREAVAMHWRSTWARDAALGAAIQAAVDDADLDLIDIAAGSIDGAGGWSA